MEFGILALDVPGNGTLYINCDNIECIWEPGFDYHRAMETSLTKIHLLKALLGSSRTCKMPKCRSLADP